MSGYKVAIAGATGNVGREMLSILAERRFPVSEVVALASPSSIGKEVSFGDRTLKCKALEHYDFSDTDICLMSAGGTVSKEWSPKIGAKGCVVIDNSSAWRMDPDVPLVVPEVNAEAAKGFVKKYIIANPNCSTAQLVVALKPLHDRADDQAGGGRDLSVGLRRRQGGDGRALLADPGGVRHRSGRAEEVPQAHRLQPHSPDRRLHGRRLDQGRVEDDGRDQEDPRPEDQADRDLRARAGVHQPFRGGQHRVREADQRRRRRATILREAPGCLVIDRREPGGYITPHEAAGEDATYISRIREDPTVENGLNLWCVSDNLRKGAALNAVQIAEVLANRGWLKPKAKAA